MPLLSIQYPFAKKLKKIRKLTPNIKIATIPVVYDYNNCQNS